MILGYENIPAFWKPALEKVEDLPFPYTGITLNQVYDLSYKHALEEILANGGERKGDSIFLAVQEPETLRFEQSFEGMYPVKELV